MMEHAAHSAKPNGPHESVCTLMGGKRSSVVRKRRKQTDEEK